MGYTVGLMRQSVGFNPSVSRNQRLGLEDYVIYVGSLTRFPNNRLRIRVSFFLMFGF